ncbi:MAG: beta-ketoacyl-[acyl-carrier-protein] synthase family protein [Archangium sp.]|nr:beta-ketoacyl-[acyl-carrier-protein] synthase family protein [Archangium sp.]
MRVRSPIVITGQGAVCALGLGLEAIWAELAAGRDGIRVIERFPTDTFSTHLGGMVPVPGTLEVDDPTGSRALCIRYAVAAGREAMRTASLSPEGNQPRRMALVLGTSMGSHLGGLHEGSAEVAAALGIAGPVITVSTACASSTNALGVGRDLLDEGLADLVVAGGADVLCPEIFAGFHALGLLSPTKCSPFSEAVGTTLGEGAGFLVLERERDATARGAPFIACFSGYGLSGDGYHATSPEPSGAGVARALRGALDDAGLAAADVGYVNAHGTGTAANDPAEWQAISQVFGERVAQLPVSSTKSYLAHAQGAAGVLELVATLLAMQHGQVLPTLHFTKPRRRGPVDPIAQDRPRALVFDHALCTNSAFGGANAAVAISRQVTPRREVTRRPIFISGASALTPPGAEAVPVHPERSRGGAGPLGPSTPLGMNGGKRLAPFRLESLVPTADTRGMDPSARALTAAVALALGDAKLTLTGAARERTGIFVGTTNASPLAWDEFRGSIKERGLVKVSAPAFTRLVLNSATGTASRLLGLRGPTTTVTSGQGSGLLALVLAAIHLDSRTDADRLVVGSVDEVDLDRDTGRSDGAASLVLTTFPAESSIRLTGWATAGADSLDDAIAHACKMAADLSGFPVHPERSRGATEAPRSDALASGSLLSCVNAVHALRLGPGRVLITDVSTAASCAVVIERSAT